jgi:NADP-dependent aldehyde dehydrogenase
MDHADGAKMVAHPLIGASAYTGSRSAGLTLKAAADKAGKPIYLELSSINPVFMLSGALDERLEKLAEEFAGSCLMGAGQFCTNPGLIVLQSGPRAEAFIDAVRKRFEATPPGTMLSEDVRRNLADSLAALQKAGAQLVTGGAVASGKGISHQNTLLRVEGERFLRDANRLQAEAFGNSSLFVIASEPEQMIEIAERMEGNLTGTIYSDTTGRDDALYDRLAPVLRPRVGRLLNDKMPTGVAVSPAMNHGGPYPATGHPGFTAVGVPASLRRFAMLECYDNVRPHRLPPALRDKNPNSKMWRAIDGAWTQADVK